jgi:ferredoxin
MVEIAVDTAKCMGHARCNAVAPGAFDLDDEGYAVVTAGAINVPLPQLHNAAESCPEQAVTVRP